MIGHEWAKSEYTAGKAFGFWIFFEILPRFFSSDEIGFFFHLDIFKFQKILVILFIRKTEVDIFLGMCFLTRIWWAFQQCIQIYCETDNVADLNGIMKKTLP